MSLPIPTPNVDPGPDWANNLNSSLGIIDSHNHTSGQGLQVPTAGININADLPFNNFAARGLLAGSFTPQASPFAGASPNLSTIYSVLGELYWNDSIGNQVKITANGSVNGSTGTITGLPSGTAGAAYVSGTQTFVFTSATLTPANIDGASFILRNLVANSKGLTLSPPAAMASNYTITLPPLPGASGNFLTIDTSGNISSSVAVDNTTIQVSSNTLQVIPGSIGPTQLTTPVGLVASAHIPSVSGGTWSLSIPTSNALIPFSTNGNFSTTTIDVSTTTFGTVSTSNGGLPQITVNNLVAGSYQVSISFMADSTVSSGVLNAYAITDGVSTFGTAVVGVTNVQQGAWLSAVFKYNSTATQTFQVLGANVVGTATVEINNDGADVRQVNFIITKIG